MNERRTNRSQKLSEALGLQLEACGSSSTLDAISVVDGDGLEVCGWGVPQHRPQLASWAVLASRHRAYFEGVARNGTRSWEVGTARLQADGAELYVCAIGGSEDERAQQLGRCALGALRILAA
jgi:hypothetical protein